MRDTRLLPGMNELDHTDQRNVSALKDLGHEEGIDDLSEVCNTVPYQSDLHRSWEALQSEEFHQRTPTAVSCKSKLPNGERPIALKKIPFTKLLLLYVRSMFFWSF